MVDESPPESEPSPEKPHKKRGFYKAKNEFDGFLRSAIGLKYKYRRYEIMRDYLIQKHKKSPEEADQIIENYKAFGVGNHSYGLSQGLKDWMASYRKTKGKNAAKARWDEDKPEEKPPS